MPIIYVVDSSVIVKWLNQTNETRLQEADQVLRDAQNGKTQLFAPELAKYEIENILLIKKKISLPEAKVSLASLHNLPIKFVAETEELALGTFKIAYEARSTGALQVTYYDSSFAALAKEKNATLVTDNAKHQKLIGNVTVIALEDYK